MRPISPFFRLSSLSFPVGQRQAMGCALALAVLASGCTSTGSRTAEIAAEKEAARIQADFPVARIQSVDSAMQAKAFAQQERVQVLEAFSIREQECHDSFFTTRCLNAAQEKKRASLNVVQEIEVEAESFLRREKVRQRDEALADKQRKDESRNQSAEKSPAQAAGQADTDDQTAPRLRDEESIPAAREAERALPAGVDPRVMRHQQYRKQQEEKEAAEAAAREQNARQFEEKQRQAEARQREIARAKAEKALKDAAAKDEAPK